MLLGIIPVKSWSACQVLECAHQVLERARQVPERVRQVPECARQVRSVRVKSRVCASSSECVCQVPSVRVKFRGARQVRVCAPSPALLDDPTLMTRPRAGAQMIEP